MPPKAARVGAAASGVGDPAFQFVLSVLKHCEAIKPDWNEVAVESGIAYGKNATARFKSIVANHGLKYADGKLTVNADAAPATNGDNTAEAAPKTAAKPRTRKRKADADVDAAGEPKTAKPPTKKGRGVTVKKEKQSQPAAKKVKEEVKKEVKEELEEDVQDEEPGSDEHGSDAEEVNGEDNDK